MKTIWKTPKLVVLVKGKSNEWVLGNCKSQYGDGPEKETTGCMNVEGTAACRGHSTT